MQHLLRGPFFSIGFRPFYLAAAGYACIAIPLWVYIRTGAGVADLPGYAWHVHEMLFGFAPAVIVGFLLTAVRNWTGQPTPAGGWLAALLGLWIAARILAFTGPSAAAAWVDLAFLPAAAIGLAIPLWRARNRRNAFVLVILLVLWLANLLFHGTHLGWAPIVLQPIANLTALNLIMLLMTVIGGRVIPVFSANAIPGCQPRRRPTIEVAAVGMLILVTLLDILAPLLGSGSAGWSRAYQMLAAIAGVVHLVRLAGWQPWKTRSNLLLYVLPLAYLWIPVHLLLRAVLGGAPGYLPSAAAHALLVGAMGGLMLAMMTRSALGHTGRPLRAGWVEALCFGAIQGAALARVFGPLASPAELVGWLIVSGGLWTLAFAAFFAGYLPILTGPRADAVPARVPGRQRL